MIIDCQEVLAIGTVAGLFIQNMYPGAGSADVFLFITFLMMLHKVINPSRELRDPESFSRTSGMLLLVRAQLTDRSSEPIGFLGDIFPSLRNVSARIISMALVQASMRKWCKSIY
jgi:hypothetical protein